MMRTTCYLAAMALAVGTHAATLAADWPQWRHDVGRTAATPEEGPARPDLLWRLHLPPPDPAFDHQYRMCADVTYAPVAAGGVLFLPSNVTDTVAAYDLETGAMRWRFAAEGPVRMAPVYWQGKVYAGSDDGFLYCLDAASGRMLWKVRGAPANAPDSRMLINSRFCSRWPVRGAPLAWRGRIYFGAGIWPEEGVYVCCVDAESGQLRWRTDALSFIKNGMSDHGRPYDLGLPPHGYPVLIDGKLAVASGRSLAAWLDPDTGAMEPYTCFYVKTNPPRGTWHLSGIGKYWIQGGNWFGTRPDAAPAVPDELTSARQALFWSREPQPNEEYVVKHRPFLRADCYQLHNENLYTDPVLTPTAAYISEFDSDLKYLVPRGHTRVQFPAFDRIVARDLTRPQWTGVRMKHYAYGKQTVSVRRLEFPILWELKSPWRVLVKAGSRLYAGGKGVVAAIAIPATGGQSRILWQAPIQGQPVNALVADGKLVVVTDQGSVHCFGNDVRQSATPDSRASAAAEFRGYGWVVGWGRGDQARSLAADGWRVVVTERDGARAARARGALLREGLHGSRIQLLTASPDQAELTPYWAERIVVSEEAAGASLRLLPRIVRALRPFTGELRIPGAADRVEEARAQLAGRADMRVQSDGGDLVVRRTSPPAGADDWTHEAGGPGNRFANSERNARWPLAALWYSGDIDRFFTPASHFQHERNPYPLVVGGRMFLITEQVLHAVDIYTGRYLWRTQLPETPWSRTRSLDSRRYGRPTERHYVAATDWVYVVSGEEIRAYDTATGAERKVFSMPEAFRDPISETQAVKTVRYQGQQLEVAAAPAWTEVRLWDDLLMATLGNRLVALDRHTGEVRWTRTSTREGATYAVGDGTLFGVDFDLPESLRRGRGDAASGLLFALDAASGREKWKRAVEYTPPPKQTVDNDRIWLRPIVPEVAYNGKHRLVIVTANRNSVFAFRAVDGKPLWSKRMPPTGNLQSIYPPAVTDDYLLLSHYNGFYGFLLDIASGREVGTDTAIPRPRTCGRALGNNDLLAYRDAATELYDIDGNRMIEFNSMRAGCTTSFIPADGIMTAPMLGHGCVCNYPMFASVALYHWDGIETVRPPRVTSAWVNQAASLIAERGPDPFAGREKVDISPFRTIRAEIEALGSAMRLTCRDSSTGYAVRTAAKPLSRATFRFAVKRAPGLGRHGNAFFVCGTSAQAGDWVECRLYYGGRSTMNIAGPLAAPAEKKLTLSRRDLFIVQVTVDCRTRSIVFEAAGQKLASRLTRPISAITHYGLGGANADNLFTPIDVVSP